MSNEHDQDPYRALVQRVHNRARKVLDEHERFQWFVQQLEPRRHEYDVEQLCHYLYAPLTWPAQRERVLVLLALHDDEEALDLLEHYDVPAGDASMSLFRAFALSVWRERHGVPRAMVTTTCEMRCQTLA